MDTRDEEVRGTKNGGRRKREEERGVKRNKSAGHVFLWSSGRRNDRFIDVTKLLESGVG